MATTKYIEIVVDSKQAKSNVDSLDRSMVGLGGSADKVQSGLSGVARAVASVIAAGSLAKFLTDAANAARLFNAAVSNLSAITGATGRDLEFLRQTALEFGATTTLSASQAAEALKLVASAKPDLLESGEALKEVTRQAILLSEASGVELAQAAATVGSALNQFGEDADQATRFVNVLAAGAKFGASEIAQTSEALKNAGVAASSAGVSFEQTNAAIQVLAATGITAGEAGTALRNIFLKLDNGLDKNLRPSVVGLEQALDNLNSKQLSGAELTKLFGLENIVAARTLLNSANQVGELERKLTGTNTALEQASRNTDNLDGDLKALNSAFESLQIRLGSLADDEMRLFVQSATGILQAVNGNKEAIAEWGGVISGAATAVESLAVVLFGRLIASTVAYVSSLQRQIATQIAATTTTNAFGQVVSRTTVAMNAATVASNGLRSAMALLGGPIGVVAIAATALIYFYDEAETAKDRSERLADEVNNLKDSFIGLTEAQRRVEIAKLNTEMSELRSQLISANNQLNNWTEQLDSGNPFAAQKVQQFKSEVESLNEQLDTLSTKQQAIFQGGLPDISTSPSASSSPTGDGSGSVIADSEFQSRLDAETEQLRLNLQLRRAVQDEFLTFDQARAIEVAANKLARQQEVYDEELLKLGENEVAKAELAATFREAQKLAVEEFELSLTDIVSEEADRRNQIKQREATQAIGMYSNYANAALSLEQAFGSKSEKAQKRRRKAAVIIDTAAGISRAFAENNFYVALGMSAAIAANGIAQIAAINSASSTPQSNVSAASATPQQGAAPSAPSSTTVIDFRARPGQAFTADDVRDILGSVEGVTLINNGLENARRLGEI